MSRLSRRAWYERVNAASPAVVPRLTAAEAVRAAKKLYRFVRRHTWTGTVKVTSGNRYSRVRWGWFSPRTGAHEGVMIVNPERGWQSLVHLLSHALYRGSHGGEHARLERRMIREVLKRGWLNGTLKRPPKVTPPRDLAAERAARAAAGLKRWLAKQKLAATKVRHYRRKVAYYARSEAA